MGKGIFKECPEIVTKTYKAQHKGFYFDVVTLDEKDEVDVYLYHEAYGTKLLIWGVLISQVKQVHGDDLYAGIEQMVYNTIDTYIPLYKEEVFDDPEEE